MRTWMLALLQLLLLTGCAHSIHRVDDVDEDKVVWVDAKQRALLTSTRPHRARAGKNGDIHDALGTTYRAYCTEPSPDVFSVLSQALSASGSFGQDKASTSAALQAAFNSTESGSTIPRTQTISMLRELMYRTCERYLSGALSELEFPIQAVRDQRLMVSILAIEQLTGVVTPRTVALTGNASANAGQNSSDAVVRLDDAWKNLQKADAAQKEAQSDYQKLEDTEPKCSALKEKVDSGNANLDDDATQQQKWSECVAQQSKVTATQTDRKKAAEHYDTLQTASANGGPVSSTTAGTATIGADPSRPDASGILAVATTVNDIIKLNFDQDEFQLFCIRALDVASSKDSQLSAKCLEYVQSKVDHVSANLKYDSARLQLDTEKLNQATKSIREASKTAFEQFWPNVVSSGDTNRADPARLQARIDAYISTASPVRSWRERLIRMRGMTEKQEIEQAFGRLDAAIQNALAQP